MASGLGIKGTVGRCYYFFEDFATCMKTDDEPLKHCRQLRDDYLECLHHKKEYARQTAIDREEARQKQEEKEKAANGGKPDGGHH